MALQISLLSFIIESRKNRIFTENKPITLFHPKIIY